MPMNALSKALKFYDMGFNPRGESLKEFIEECNQRMGLIEELYKDPKSYLEKKYGISSDISSS
ncbi:MAG: hypothetical protein QXR09_03805 [Candidatus Aenigmatarchaeota archaeon]